MSRVILRPRYRRRWPLFKIHLLKYQSTLFFKFFSGRNFALLIALEIHKYVLDYYLIIL